jgi:hypothetical protein
VTRGSLSADRSVAAAVVDEDDLKAQGLAFQHLQEFFIQRFDAVLFVVNRDGDRQVDMLQTVVFAGIHRRIDWMVCR